jgi:hypothetical protein
MKKLYLVVIATTLILSLGLTTKVHAYSVLNDWFGVTLTTGTIHGFENQFTNSWAPTKNVTTAQYAIDNFRYYWDGTAYVQGNAPVGGELYDVEAMYFGNTSTDVYLAIVTSWPPTGHSIAGDLIIPGDIAIGLNGDMYDYGIQVVENITKSGNYVTGFTLGNGKIYDTALGNWFVGNPASDIPGTGDELTNFSGGTYKGLSSHFAYYQYDFASGNDNLQDGGYPTYVLEAVFSRGLLDNPPDGTKVTTAWEMGCRNDWNNGQFVLKGQLLPEPASLSLLGLGVLGLFGLRKKA